MERGWEAGAGVERQDDSQNTSPRLVLVTILLLSLSVERASVNHPEESKTFPWQPDYDQTARVKTTF